MDRAGAAIITVGGLWQCGGVEEFEDRVVGGEPAEERPTTAAGASAESGPDPSSTPAAIDPSAPLADLVEGGGDRPENVSTIWQGEGMEEFGDPAQGQNQANMPDLAAAIAAVVLPVVPAAVPVVDPPVVRVRDRAHPGGLSLPAARAWQDAAEDRYTDTVAAITETARLEARTAALKTVLVASLDAVSEELGRGLGMDSWQSSQQGVSTTE
ncbi:MAG TPA: hypothetical protein VGN49_01585, partial [Micrococcaceae bacterium]|nr:hypothetical protein [Micrococcaceae bacterium]